MNPRGTIAQLAKLVGQDLSRGELSQDAMETGPMLARAGATAELIACLFAEARRKRPSERVINGYSFLLQSALDALRLDASEGDSQARQGIEDARMEVERALARGSIATPILMLVARAFVEAQLDPGRALQEAMMGAMETEGRAEGANMEPPAIAEHLAEVAEALGHDPFAIHAEIAASGAAFPAEHKAAMAAAFAASDVPAIREAALGFALDPDPEVGAAVLSVLANVGRAQPVLGISVERLVRIRPWLPEARRAGLDAAIRVLRPRADASGPSVRPEIRTVLASMCDGAGAQSLFVLAKRGRRFALASALVKAGMGVADAWVRDGMTKSEADDLIEQIVAATEAADVSIGFIGRRLADALAVNLQRDVPPPFGLLQVTETLGLGSLQPEAISPAALVDELLEGLPPERTDPKAVLSAHRASARWADAFETIVSWFEAGEEVEALLRPITSRRKRLEAVLTQCLPARRMFWAERCAWMAATIQEATDESGREWIDFALVARDFAGDQPLQAFPLAAVIAAATVDSFAQRSAERSSVPASRPAPRATQRRRR